MLSSTADLLKPRIIDVETVSPLRARVIMEPFERGYGCLCYTSDAADDAFRLELACRSIIQ